MTQDTTDNQNMDNANYAESADENTGTKKTDLAHELTRIVSEGVAKAKVAYEQAGGIDGISQNTVKKAAEIGANAKVIGENIAESDAFKNAVDAIKVWAVKVAETDAIKNIQHKTTELRDIAVDTYSKTYDIKKHHVDNASNSTDEKEASAT